VWCHHAAREADLAWSSYHMNRRDFDRSSRAQFAKDRSQTHDTWARNRVGFSARSAADLRATCSSRRGRRRAHRCGCRGARRGGCRLVALSPSFMPDLLTRMPPRLSDLVSCDTGRPCCRFDIRRCDIRLCRRRWRSGHRRRRGSRGWARGACGDERQSRRDHQRFS
jgi:hypothetical protein